MISFRTIATMAKWDCQTIVATTEGGGIEREQRARPGLPLERGREGGTRGGRGGGKAADTNVVKSLCKKGPHWLLLSLTHGPLLGVGADLARGIP